MVHVVRYFLSDYNEYNILFETNMNKVYNSLLFQLIQAFDLQDEQAFAFSKLLH
jgi:hypothetical protein